MKYAQVILTRGTDEQSTPILSLSKQLQKKLKIPIHKRLTLSCGDRYTTVICVTNNSQSKLVQIPPHIGQHLLIPNQTQVYLQYNRQNKELRVAPILALLVNRYVKNKPPFSEMNAFCKEVIHFAHQRHIVCYVVTLEDLANNLTEVNGWTYDNTWKQRKFPMPTIVYNRISSRKLERTHLFQSLKAKLEQNNIQLFNHTFLNKWEVYTTLTKHPELIPLQPETKPFKGSLCIKEMLQKYATIFLKPIHGSLGRGIYRISRGLNGFQVEYSTINGQLIKHFRSLKSLLAYVKSRIKRNYIVQQGIPILHINQRAVDFRALMQKNSHGEWSMTSIVARIGSENHFVSNVDRGGRISKVLKTLQQGQVPQPTDAYRRLIKAAKMVSKAIDHSSKGLFGELGVDLAITHSGKIYVLEVNSKPSKTDSSLPQDSNASKGRPSVHRLLDYALYLDKKSKNEV